VKENTVNNEEADIVTIVSSDLIATVMEEFFNRKMYKLPVKIVELKPTEAGYSFFLQFVVKEKAVKPMFPDLPEETKLVVDEMLLIENGGKPITWTAEIDKDFRNGIRDSKGRFVKAKGVQ